MTYPTIDWAFDQDVSPTAKLVLVALASHANQIGMCWPSNARLVKRTGLSVRAVRGALRTLEDSRILRTELREGGSSTYYLSISYQGTPAADAGVKEGTPAADASLPGISCRPPRQQMPPSPAADASELPLNYLLLPTSHTDVANATSDQTVLTLGQDAQAVAPPAALIPLPADSPAEAKPAKDPRGSRLPEDWKPSAADCAYARDHGQDPVQMAEDFRDWWHAQPGSRGRMANWSLVWKTRCRQLERWAKERKKTSAAPLFARTQREVPYEAGNRIVSEIVEKCYKLTNVDYDGLWDSNEFSLLIADALTAGNSPENEIFPLMTRAAKHSSGPGSLGPAWFRSVLKPKLRAVA